MTALAHFFQIEAVIRTTVAIHLYFAHLHHIYSHIVHIYLTHNIFQFDKSITITTGMVLPRGKKDDVTVEESLQEGIDLAGQGMLHDALSVFDKILDTYPNEPRALFNAAVVLDRLGQRDTAFTLLHRSIDADPTFANPHHYLGKLCLQSGRYAEAYQYFRDAIARNVEFVPAFDGAQLAASAMGMPIVSDNPDIVFYTGGPPFNGKTMEEKGLGGSEAGLINIARTLAAKGKRVRVFCNCDRPGDYDGVRYDDLVDFHIYRKLYPLPILISSRSPRPFKIDMQVQARILWIRDDVDVAFLKGEDPARLPTDRIFAISQWQRDKWSRRYGIPPERFFLTRNGVDLTVFKPGEKRDRHRLIYTSRPDRGLDVLLKLFPHIRQRVPDAELHLYVYSLPDDRLDDPVLTQSQQPGVYMHGSLTKAALSKEIACARLMAYPSTFHETSCNAAIEAQASGTPVVASTLAALPETVHNGVSGRLIPGNPHSAKFGRCFVEAVVALLTNDEAWQRLSLGARSRCELQYDWRIVAEEWLVELQRIVATKNTYKQNNANGRES